MLTLMLMLAAICHVAAIILIHSEPKRLANLVVAARNEKRQCPEGPTVVVITNHERDIEIDQHHCNDREKCNMFNW